MFSLHVFTSQVTHITKPVIKKTLLKKCSIKAIQSATYSAAIKFIRGNEMRNIPEVKSFYSQLDGARYCGQVLEGALHF